MTNITIIFEVSTSIRFCFQIFAHYVGRVILKTAAAINFIKLQNIHLDCYILNVFMQITDFAPYAFIKIQ